MTILLCAFSILCAAGGDSEKRSPLDVYFVDMNGGGATLIVTPAGETVLVDSGQAVQRDADRIEDVLRNVVGKPRIDHLITTHWHLDHYGAIGLLEGKIEFGRFYDKGIPDQLPEDPANFPKLIAAYKRVSKGKSITIKPGDTIPLKQVAGEKVELTCLMANAAKPLDMKGERNKYCNQYKACKPDTSDNGQSIALLLRFGDFEFFNPADLTWNIERELVCPDNIVGQVELMQVAHHGLSVSSNPVMVHSLAPKVAIMANGPTKGGDREVLATYKASPGLEDIWQLHRNWAVDEKDNLPKNRTANWDNKNGGQYVHVRVSADTKTFDVRVGNAGPSKQYTCWPAKKQDHTNVVIIYADDLGYGELSCYGHPKFKTPNLDRMADEGVRMTNFYSSCPYCAPARVSLQTGRYQVRSGLTLNPCPGSTQDDIGIPQTEVTLGEAFQSAGFATACIGKWHLGHKPRFYPRKNGYDEYFGILYSNDMHPVELWDNETVVEYPIFQPTITRRYTDRAISFIERNKDKPFFLYLPHAMPHKPLAASEQFYKKSGAGLYGDVIAELDHEIGRLIQRLKDLNLDKNTLVFFTSDNGPWYGGDTGGLRGMKARTWEGGLRVPMIAWSPGRIPAGQTNSEPAIIMDLFTTSLKAANIEMPDDRVIDGKDIMPLLTENAKSPHEALFSFRGPALHTVTVGDYKLHLRDPRAGKEKRWRADEEWIDPRRPDGVTIIAQFEQAHPSEFPGVLDGDVFKANGLFNIKEDPSEQHDISKAHPQIVERLRAIAKKNWPDYVK